MTAPHNTTRDKAKLSAHLDKCKTPDYQVLRRAVPRPVVKKVYPPGFAAKLRAQLEQSAATAFTYQGIEKARGKERRMARIAIAGFMAFHPYFHGTRLSQIADQLGVHERTAARYVDAYSAYVSPHASGPDAEVMQRGLSKMIRSQKAMGWRDD